MLSACFAETSFITRSLFLSPCSFLFKGYKVVCVLSLYSVAKLSVLDDDFLFSCLVFLLQGSVGGSFHGKALWLLGVGGCLDSCGLSEGPASVADGHLATWAHSRRGGRRGRGTGEALELPR